MNRISLKRVEGLSALKDAQATYEEGGISLKRVEGFVKSLHSILIILSRISLKRVEGASPEA